MKKFLLLMCLFGLPLVSKSQTSTQRATLVPQTSYGFSLGNWSLPWDSLSARYLWNPGGVFSILDTTNISGYLRINNLEALSGDMVAIRDTTRTSFPMGIGSSTRTIDSTLTVFLPGSSTEYGGIHVGGIDSEGLIQLLGDSVSYTDPGFPATIPNSGFALGRNLYLTRRGTIALGNMYAPGVYPTDTVKLQNIVTIRNNNLWITRQTSTQFSGIGLYLFIPNTQDSGAYLFHIERQAGGTSGYNDLLVNYQPSQADTGDGTNPNNLTFLRFHPETRMLLFNTQRDGNVDWWPDARFDHGYVHVASGNLYVNGTIYDTSSAQIFQQAIGSHTSGTVLSLVNTSVSNNANWQILSQGSANTKPKGFGLYDVRAGGMRFEIDSTGAVSTNSGSFTAGAISGTTGGFTGQLTAASGLFGTTGTITSGYMGDFFNSSHSRLLIRSSGDAVAQLGLRNSSGDWNIVNERIANNKQLQFLRGGTLKMSLDTTGNLTVTGKATVADTIRSGNFVTYSYFIPGGALVQSSTESVKKNIRPYTADLTKFSLVKPRKYNFREEAFLRLFDESTLPDSLSEREKGDARKKFREDNLKEASEKSKREMVGFLAEEFNSILGKDSKEINQQDVINVLWLKVQELERRIEALEKR